MEIPGKKIAIVLESILKKEIKKSKKKLKLVTFLVGPAQDQLSFVRMKAKVAKRLGIQFELVHLHQVPSFESFMHSLKEKAIDPKTTGIIIQQPLPAQLSTSSIYDYFPLTKEIEGHKNKSPYLPPVGLAVLTVFKYGLNQSKIDKNLLIDLKRDHHMFKKILRNKRVVLIGRGVTGGQPIGKTLNEMKINFISINSQTPEPEVYYKDADIIISAVGHKVIDSSMLKPGVALINIGLRYESGRLKGDYDEADIKSFASFYTSTPGGVGPIDVIYLYKNLLQASKMQKKS